MRLLDKITPKLTHMHNQLATIFNRGASVADLRASHQRQGAELERLYPWAKATLALFRQACEAAEKLAEEVECEEVECEDAPPSWRSWTAIRQAALVGADIPGAPWVPDVLQKLRALAAAHPANAKGGFVSPRLLNVALRELAQGIAPGRRWLACMRRELGLDPITGDPA